MLKISSAKLKNKFERRKIKDSMNVQNEEKVEDSLELLMRGEWGEIVEGSFDQIQEQEQDDNEEEEVGIIFILT